MENTQRQTTFSEAMDQLHNIASQLEKDDIDPDQLVELVRQAETLIKFCREKLSETEVTVQDILNRLQEAENEGQEITTNDIP